MPRDYHAEHVARTERAHERGFGSYNEERQARDRAYEMGASRDNVERYAGFMHDYTAGHVDDAGEWHNGGMDLDDFKEMWMELHDIDEWDEDYWEDFYAWLEEFYSDN